MANTKFEFCFNDLTKSAQKRFLETIGVSTKFELRLGDLNDSAKHRFLKTVDTSNQIKYSRSLDELPITTICFDGSSYCRKIEVIQ